MIVWLVRIYFSKKRFKLVAVSYLFRYLSVVKDEDDSSLHEKESIYTTRLIASSEEYIKDDTERSDSILFKPDENDIEDISVYDFYSAPEVSNQQPEEATSSFSPPNEIYFGFKPVVKG